MRTEHCIDVPTNENLAMNPAETVEVLHTALENTFELNLNISIFRNKKKVNIIISLKLRHSLILYTLQQSEFECRLNPHSKMKLVILNT